MSIKILHNSTNYLKFRRLEVNSIFRVYFDLHCFFKYFFITLIKFKPVRMVNCFDYLINMLILLDFFSKMNIIFEEFIYFLNYLI